MDKNLLWNNKIELILREYSIDVGIVETKEKDKNGNLKRVQNEVDFVCNLGSKRCYIQSAYSIPTKEKQNQETRPLNKIKDSFKKIVITNDIIPSFYNDDCIMFINIFDFLLNKSLID